MIFEILNNNTDINNNIEPITKKIITIIVYGIEKYLVSLNTVTTLTAKTIPKNIKIVPGMPMNFNGDFMAIISKSDVITSPECEIGFLVDVFIPVS